MRYFLCWLLLGGAFAVAGGSVWCFVARNSSRRKIVLGLLPILATMLGGSQWAAQSSRGRLFVAVEAVQWDHSSQEFVLTVESPRPVAAALKKGDLKTLVLIRGERTVRVDARALTAEEATVEFNGPEFIVTAGRIHMGESEWRQATVRVDAKGSAVLGWNFEAGLSDLVEAKGLLQASKLNYFGPTERYTLRVPWNLEGHSTGASFKVNVAIASKDGVQIGPMTTTSFRSIALPLREESD